MPKVAPPEIKRIRAYALATLPFIALFAYQLSTLLAHRPLVPDPMHGYTIALGSEGSDKGVYVSSADLAWILIPFFIGFAITAIGLWRAGVFRLLRR